MKRILSIILTLCMCLTLGAALTACDFGTTDPGHTHTYETVWSYNDTHHWYACIDEDCSKTSKKAEHSIVSGTCSVCGQNTVNNIIACSYEIVSAPTENGLIIIDSVTDGKSNYYIIDLGYAKNVPIWSGTAIYYNENQLNAPELKFVKGQQTEKSVEQSITNTISKTVATSQSLENNITAGFEAGYEDFGAAFKTKVEISESRTWGSSTENENSTTNAYSVAQTIAESYQSEVAFSTGGSGYGWYRLSMLATCDIYAMMKTDINLTKVEEIKYTICPRNDANLSIEYSQTNDWIDSSAKKIEDPEKQLYKLTVPSKILVDGEILSDDWESSIYTKTLNETIINITDSTKSDSYGGSTLFTIEIPDEYKYLQSIGKLHIKITATYNSTLQYRSDYKFATATIKSSFGTFEKQIVTSLKAQGGGWPGTWINPAYGEIVNATGTVNQSFLVDNLEMDVMFNFVYVMEFEEFTHPNGWFGQHGTHAVNFSCDFSNITYNFYVSDD